MENEYTCAICQETYIKGLTDDDAECFQLNAVTGSKRHLRAVCAEIAQQRVGGIHALVELVCSDNLYNAFRRVDLLTNGRDASAPDAYGRLDGAFRIRKDG